MTVIANNSKVVDLLVQNIETGAGKMELSSTGISSSTACVNVSADTDCDSSYSNGCSLMTAVQTHVLHAAGYIKQIDAALQQADQTVVNRTVQSAP